MPRPPDILHLTSDQHARKITGCYGDPIVRTPHLDALAGRGVVFDAAHCPSPLCVPSRMSALTGRWPADLGCWTLQDMLASDAPTWVHALGARGYRTILVGRMHAIGPDQLHGFEERHVGEPGANWLGARRQDLGVLAGAQGPDPVSLRHSGRGQSAYQLADMAATEVACARLRELGRARAKGDLRPFCLSLGLVLPHCPFVAWPEDFDLYDGKVGLPALSRPDPASEHPWLAWWRQDRGIEDPDPADVVRARTAYHGLVTRTDIILGQVMEALEESGLAGTTLVVYSSDHGEQLGERGLWWKNTMHAESVEVPLIMAWPGQLPAGERRAQVVNLVDLAATLVEAAGAPPLPRAVGASLLAVARNPTSPWLDETFAEYATDLMPAWTGSTPTCQRMVRTSRFKLVYIHGHRPQLFDLEADPNELDDLGEHPKFTAVREQLLAKVLAGWDPAAIAHELARRRQDKNLLTTWGATTQPASQFVFPLEGRERWLDDPPT